MSRYQERLGAHEVAAAKEQASGGKKSVPSWGDELNSAGLDIRRTSPDLLMDLIPVETAAINVGDEANTDAAMEAQKYADNIARVEAEYAKQQAATGRGDVNVKTSTGTYTISGNMDPSVAERMLQEARDAQSGKSKKIVNPFAEMEARVAEYKKRKSASSNN
jgi:hypothetical protein